MACLNSLKLSPKINVSSVNNFRTACRSVPALSWQIRRYCVFCYCYNFSKSSVSICVASSGVRSLNFWLRLHSCFGWLYSDSETFASFAPPLLLKLQIECYKLLKKRLRLWLFVKKSTPAPALFWKFITAPAGVHSYTPAPVHDWWSVYFRENKSSAYLWASPFLPGITPGYRIALWCWFVNNLFRNPCRPIFMSIFTNGWL